MKYFPLFLAVLFNVLANIALKSAAQYDTLGLNYAENFKFKPQYLYALAVIAYTFAFLSYAVTLRFIPLWKAYPVITCLTMFASILISFKLFHELIGIKEIFGIIFMICGFLLLL